MIVRIVFLLFVYTQIGSAQNSYRGEFSVYKVIYYGDTLNQYTTFQTYSNLYSDTVTSPNYLLAGNYGEVRYNQVACNFNTATRTFMDSVLREENSGIHWTLVSSNTVIPSFTATCNDSFPGILSLREVIPDTIDKSDGFNVDFGSASNCDEIHLYISDGQLHLLTPFNRQETASVTSFSISGSDLTPLNNDFVTVVLSFIKTEYQLLNGHRFKFVKRFNLSHNAILKP